MAVVLGTNAGFVAAQPTGDPDGSNSSFSQRRYATADTSPATGFTITELGWYQSSATNDSGLYNMGIYSNDAARNSGAGGPNVLIETQSSGQSTTANTAQWERYTVSYTGMSTSTKYWVAVAIESIVSANGMDVAASGGQSAYYAANLPMPDDWGAAGTYNAYIAAFYALYEAAAGGRTTRNTDPLMNVMPGVGFQVQTPL